MCPVCVEVDQSKRGYIDNVGSIDIPHPLNPFAFGGRATYFSDFIPYATIIGPEGDEIGKMLSSQGDSLHMVIDISSLAPNSEQKTYTITITKI